MALGISRFCTADSQCYARCTWGQCFASVSAGFLLGLALYGRQTFGWEREKQLYRDWIWYKTWGRYAWNCRRDRTDEINYWNNQFAGFYGTSDGDGAAIRMAYEESGEIAPKLLRRFGITEGNRQTLLLGMFMSQLVNPYKYTIYPGFYESCGPEGEKLIEYVEKEGKSNPM